MRTEAKVSLLNQRASGECCCILLKQQNTAAREISHWWMFVYQHSLSSESMLVGWLVEDGKIIDFSQQKCINLN